VIEQFSPDVLADLSGFSPRQGRHEAAALAQAVPWPSTETEEWRYSPIGELPVGDLRPASQPGSSEPPLPVEAIESPAAVVTIVDGFVIDIAVDSGWVAKGLDVAVDPDRSIGPVEGEATTFDHWHQAFAPGPVVIRTGSGVAVTSPIVVVNHHSTPGAAGFPHVVVEAAEGSELQVIEWQTSTDETAFSAPVVELDVQPAARLGYLTVQQTGSRFWTVGRHRSSVASQATLTTGIAAFGSRYGRVRTDSRLVGRGATANLVAAYYGDGDQIHDFRTFQHHQARDTKSDLLFKGAQDDRSGSIYTGLIHIHPDGAGSNAFQTNRNIKLSDDAWAWSVPNLEIENNEVHCSHASTVSPVDDEQRFYLGARGVPPGPADRLIVAGFFNDVMARMPVAAVRPRLAELVAEKLDRRGAANE
jgi:Fe-S cluster assembly protein SufD